MNVKEIREILGLTQRQLALRLETTERTISRWETEGTGPGGFYQRRLLDELQGLAAKTQAMRGWRPVPTKPPAPKPAPPVEPVEVEPDSVSPTPKIRTPFGE